MELRAPLVQQQKDDQRRESLKLNLIVCVSPFAIENCEDEMFSIWCKLFGSVLFFADFENFFYVMLSGDACIIQDFMVNE